MSVEVWQNRAIVLFAASWGRFSCAIALNCGKPETGTIWLWQRYDSSFSVWQSYPSLLRFGQSICLPFRPES